jgi:hypothetical protein
MYKTTFQFKIDCYGQSSPENIHLARSMPPRVPDPMNMCHTPLQAIISAHRVTVMHKHFVV